MNNQITFYSFHMFILLINIIDIMKSMSVTTNKIICVNGIFLGISTGSSPFKILIIPFQY